MKFPKKGNRVLLGVIFLVTGLLLIWKNSWGHYFDPWMKGMFKNRMSYWLMAIGIALIFASIIMFIPLRDKENPSNNSSADRI